MFQLSAKPNPPFPLPQRRRLNRASTRTVPCVLLVEDLETPAEQLAVAVDQRERVLTRPRREGLKSMTSIQRDEGIRRGIVRGRPPLVTLSHSRSFQWFHASRRVSGEDISC